jgi:hypothetical protein
LPDEPAPPSRATVSLPEEKTKLVLNVDMLLAFFFGCWHDRRPLVERDRSRTGPE